MYMYVLLTKFILRNERIRFSLDFQLQLCVKWLHFNRYSFVSSLLEYKSATLYMWIWLAALLGTEFCVRIVYVCHAHPRSLKSSNSRCIFLLHKGYSNHLVFVCVFVMSQSLDYKFYTTK